MTKNFTTGLVILAFSIIVLIFLALKSSHIPSGAVVALIGLGAVAFIVVRRH